MPRRQSKTRYGSFPPGDNEYSRLTMERIFRIAAKESEKSFDRWTSHFDHKRLKDKEKKNTNQRQVGLQDGVQQSRLATETGIKRDKKTHKHKESTAGDDEKHGDIYFARAVPD